MAETIASIFGYAASVLVAVSLLVNAALKFRWINAMGGICFIIYGVIIHAFPVMLTNSILLAINSYRLFQLYRIKERFDLIEIRDVSSNPLILNFLQTYKAGIQAYFPEYKAGMPTDNCISFVVMRDAVIANIFVDINYTVPRYRDYKVGNFIFEREKRFLISKGIKNIVYEKIYHKDHRDFLNVMGFKNEPVNGKECLVKKIA